MAYQTQSKARPEAFVCHAGQEEQRRGKGDLEFENQIAMAMMASASSGPTENGAGQPAVAPASRGAALKLLAAKGEGVVGLGATWARGSQRSQVRLRAKPAWQLPNVQQRPGKRTPLVINAAIVFGPQYV